MDMGEERIYSQDEAAAMRRRIERQRVTLRRLWCMIGILNREADRQAKTIVQLREGIELWRGRYVSALTEQNHQDRP